MMVAKSKDSAAKRANASAVMIWCLMTVLVTLEGDGVMGCRNWTNTVE
jgi:hypothetical protein